MKMCTRCGVSYPATTAYFHRSAERKDGLKAGCKRCRCADTQAYAESHAEQCRMSKREWAARKRAARDQSTYDRDCAKKREYARARRAADPEEERRRQRAWWEQHRHELAERRRRRYGEDPEHRERVLAQQRSSRKSEAHREVERERKARRRRWFYENLRILKAAQGCSVCGRRHGRLDHHHIDPSTKKYSVSRMAHTSLETFIDEIAKCTVLCASCHAKLPKQAR